MEAAIEALRNKELGSYKASIVLNLLHTPERYVKTGRKAKVK